MQFEGKNVLIIGMARSGIAAAEKLKSLGADVTIVDRSVDPKLEARSLNLMEKGVRTRLGPHVASDLDRKELVIASPGVPPSNDLLIQAKKRGIRIWSEVELAYTLTSCPIIGITGTNGKTTTTSLTGDIFGQAGRKGVVAGNIGFPLIKAVNLESDAMLIVELSSFQLEHIESFRPYISVLLNITEDHLDWHSDFDEYTRAKRKIFMNQTERDFAVINYDDPIARELSKSTRAKVIALSKRDSLDQGIHVENGKIVSLINGREEICSIDELKIGGEHNLDNAMAAAAAGLIAGISVEDVGRALSEFRGIPHRIEFVASLDGVDYYNDSKATNPDATAKALMSFTTPVILLAGGRNKGNSFRRLASDIKKTAKAVVLFGEAAVEIYPLLKELDLQVVRVETVPEAVVEAKKFSKAGDTILFSPGCASFDQFSDYKERGQVFKDAVMSLSEILQ
jgi:UDP-N-acetylmuramoylalanine--D-glutamate ligase